jgi:pentatricopeptide repeat protein
MLAALRLHPEKAHLFLQATFEESITPAYAARDVMGFLVHRTARLSEGERLAARESIAGSIFLLLEKSSSRYLQFSQAVLYCAMETMNPDTLALFYEKLERYGHPLHHNTLLNLAGRLAKDVNHKRLSVQILERLLDSESLDINTPHGAALCTSILSIKKDQISVEMPSTPAELFERLLDLGLVPNLLTYTVIIRNLCLNRELSTAWQVFDVMVERHIEPDAYLYSILMNGAKHCQDFDSMLRVAQAAYLDEIRDPIVWNDLLHGILLSCLSEDRQMRAKSHKVLPAFRYMLMAYTRFFNLDPLKQLVISDVDLDLHSDELPGELSESEMKMLSLISDLPSSELGDLVEPTSDTLGIMLVGYVAGFSKPFDVISFYSQFRKLLQSGDETARRLVEEQGTLVYDVAIKAAMKWKGLLHIALGIVSDMLQVEVSLTGNSNTRPRISVEDESGPKPSVYTWSILLNGFLSHNETVQAERVLQMMRENGVEPTIVTWNTLVAGYARLQNVGNTVRALQRLEASGVEADDFTFKAFSYLKDQESALRQMDEMVARRETRSEAPQRFGQEQEDSGKEAITDELRRLESEADNMFAMIRDQDGDAHEMSISNDERIK